jgi:patatin-like phospholipase/acyl hydrolase
LPAHSFIFNQKEVVCIDGGVFINNPSMGALAEVSKYSEYYGLTTNDTQFDFNNLMILSLSTGHYTGSINKNDALNWGKLKWIKPVIDIFMYGVNQATDYEVSELLPKANYLRININIDIEKYAVMTNSSKECSNYLMKEVDSQVFQNATLMNELKLFADKLI